MSINYEKLLDDWAEKLYKDAEAIEKRFDDNSFSYRRGKQEGYIDGLIMAIAILNRMEKKLGNEL